MSGGYPSGYPVPPNDRGGGAIFILVLAIAVGVLAIGSGWLSLNALLGRNGGAPTNAAATATAIAQAAPTATPSGRPQLLSVAEWDIPNGHFFTQTNGEPALSSVRGYAVTNDGNAPFWDEFRRLGGVARVGYPLSGRFKWLGLDTQVFQRAILQWNPGPRMMQAVNVMDELHNRGKDEWLLEKHDTPKPLAPDFDRGRTLAEVTRNRMSLLVADPAMQIYYGTAPDPMLLYGLPASQIADMGDHYALRTQRGVLERWKEDRPWARAGDVTAANSGQIAVEAGLIPQEMLAPQVAPQLP